MVFNWIVEKKIVTMLNITIVLVFFLSLSQSGIQAQNMTIEQGFKNPPNEAKARTWWHWINGNVTKEAITADLEAMKEIGIQGAQLFDVSLGEPNGGVTYLSPEWLELFKYSAVEAQRLGLELAFHNCSGWSSTGGPGITPEYAMQTVTYADTVILGGKRFKGYLPQTQKKLYYYKDIAVLAFPKPASAQRIDHLDYKTLSGKVRNHLAPDDKLVPEEAVVRKADILDLTSQLDKDGVLEWEVPEGEWVILRIGHTPTGAKNRFPSKGGSGLECDKMNPAAVDVFWNASLMPIIEELDTLIGSVVKKIHIDSYEVGTANWTSNFANEFQQLRSYDCRLYLPTLAGYYVESGEETERFLWDFRRTIGDLMAENYYGRFRDLSHQYGMLFSTEPYWGPFDNMQVGATADLVMCEFWSGDLAFFDSPKFVASIAKLNGQTIAEAEGFTDMGGWKQHPASLKPMGDLAWTQGVNRFVFHSYVHQPYGIPPGLTLGPFGIDLNRLNTWWTQGKPFFDYINRGQFLLQQGRTVADFLVFTGQASPNDALLVPEIRALGYDYDLIGSNKINSLTVKDGLICTAMGDKYCALLIPKVDWMTPEMLNKLGELAQGGAKIVASKPQKSPSLKNYPSRDEALKALANKLWDSGLIKDITIHEVLESAQLQPDLILENSEIQSIDYIHRKTKDAEIYFVVNAQKQSRALNCRFRVSGKQPELWNAENGEVTKLVQWKDNGDGTTSIPLNFGAQEAMFIVFRDAPSSNDYIAQATMTLNKPKAEALPGLEITKAEYGTFLPPALVDVTAVVRKLISENKLIVNADRGLCSADPAPGYHKELRIEYQIEDNVFEAYANEREVLEIDANGLGDLRVLKAVFGKFERGVEGIPPGQPNVDVSDEVNRMLATGSYEVPANDDLLTQKMDISTSKALRVAYVTDGEEKVRTVPFGSSLKLSQTLPEARLEMHEQIAIWRTPYTGVLHYTTVSGQSKTVVVESVPQTIDLSPDWVVEFPQIGKEYYDQLISWTSSTNDDVRYFSGTATYTKQFEVPRKLLKEDYTLELDLGNVQVIAEVILNGKELGVLWKAPFIICIDEAVKPGINTIEIEVTNLWPNRLIGDEHLPLDYERKGNNIKQWPEWLSNPEERPTQRSTLPAYTHWRKDDELLPSGLRGPVKIVVSKVVELE